MSRCSQGYVAILLLLICSTLTFAFPRITSSVRTEFATYTPKVVDVTPNVKPYVIEPGLGNVSNRDAFDFTPAEISLLIKNGFVARPSGFKQIYDVYNYCQDAGIPIFVTTDSVLHVYHILYDYSLRMMETQELYYDLSKLNSAMLAESVSQYERATNQLSKEYARKNVAFFAVGSLLLEPSVKVPQMVVDLVNQELNLIMAHAGFLRSPIFGYEEDYSQYIPRGHYTRNERLERYFRSMMWYGRMAFRITPREGSEKGIEETARAILITAGMKRLSINGQPAIEIWDRIYSPTAFFVGKADDLTIIEYLELMERVFGPNYASLSPDDLTEEAKVKEFIELAKELRNPMINSSLVWQGEKTEVVTKGFRFMGQRFIPDSYMFQQLVHDAVYGRLLPKGLDVMAVMGSDRALDILLNVYDEDRYENYEDQIKKLRSYLNKMDEEIWAQNLYWNWLYVLMPLLGPKGGGYPIFMQSKAWLDKDLTTALGSWAELRHDTILYAKQSYTKVTSMPPRPPLVKGYVEPDPEVYARLSALTRFTVEGLSNRGLLLPEFSSKFSLFENLLLSLLEISMLELTNEPLNYEHYAVISNIGKTLKEITTFPPEIAGQIEGDEDKEMAVIADVHTDVNTGQVLEVGVGYPFNIFVVVPIEGELRIAQGGMFAYYEFTSPMDKRLTDKQWQTMLATEPPELPVWIGSFVDLSKKHDLGGHISVDGEGMGWLPTRIDAKIEPKVVDIGAKLNVIAIVFGELDSAPKVTIKQGNITKEYLMEETQDGFSASIDTTGFNIGSALVTIVGKSGEEEVIYEEEIGIEKASAVEPWIDLSQSSEYRSELKTRVYRPFPNPFNPDVWIPFELSKGEHVTIEIYNVVGNLIRTIDLGYRQSGSYISIDRAGYWDGRDSNGQQVSSGIYFYKLKAGNFVAVGKLVTIK